MEVSDSPPLVKVSREGLESLRDILNSSKTGSQTLTNRKVMIPITTKAFFEGELQPTIRQNNTDRSKDEEQVMMNIGQGYLADMTIDEATSVIDRRLKALRCISKEKVKKGKKLALKKGFLQQKQSKPAIKKSTAQPNPSMSALPFMEIREEYDEDGNEITSETMNISKVLHNVKNEIKNKQGREESKNEMLNALLQGVSNTSDIHDNDETDIQVNYDDDDDDDANEEQEVPKARPYKEISARLDELIRIEEEAELNKKANRKSAKKLQGTGWKKGFLSNVSNGKTSKKGFAVSSARVKQTPLEVTSKVPSREKKVQFQASHAVKEIPRIGTRSVKAPTQYPEIEELSSSLEQTVLSTTMQTRPSKSVSIGGVMEKNTLHQNSESGRRINTSTITSSVEPEKKLSRFAQRRQQQK